MAPGVERPMLFKGPLVRAILEGRKTVTRRIIKLDTGPLSVDGGEYKQHWLFGPGNTPRSFAWPIGEEPGREMDTRCPHGQVGDRLYVREAWRTGSALDEYSPAEIRRRAIDAGYDKVWGPLKYEADGREVGSGCLNDFGGSWGKYRQGMHILREFSRIDLDIVSVRAERVQEITEEDALAEGVDCRVLGFDPVSGKQCEVMIPARAAFAHLWDGINGKRGPKGDPTAYSWEHDPWVFRIEWPTYSAVSPA